MNDKKIDPLTGEEVPQGITNSNPTPVAKPLDIDSIDLSTEDSLALISKLTPVAAASLEYLMRHPSLYPSQAVAAAKIVLERKLGAVPDTMIQNNVQYIIKWED